MLDDAREPALCEYMRRSAVRSASAALAASEGIATAPWDAVITNPSPSSHRAAEHEASTVARAACSTDQITQNSSPPSLYTRPALPTASRNRAPRRSSRESPAG